MQTNGEKCTFLYCLGIVVVLLVNVRGCVDRLSDYPKFSPDKADVFIEYSAKTMLWPGVAAYGAGKSLFATEWKARPAKPAPVEPEACK